ncbi:embryo defective protein [Artemisia annua]|uniref:Embryo defective protein n=1 Tax=Artemisia annua TaxID=35608 RepID=A0A2U1M0M4_ARTAN|nr:embryo defective protein [Artemisia annua]
MATYLWRKYADYLHTKWEKEVLWTMVDPYKRPKSFSPLVKIYVCAFYTGVIGAAITEQLYKVTQIITICQRVRNRCISKHHLL